MTLIPTTILPYQFHNFIKRAVENQAKEKSHGTNPWENLLFINAKVPAYHLDSGLPPAFSHRYNQHRYPWWSRNPSVP